MTGNGPGSKDARRSSCVVSCSVIAMSGWQTTVVPTGQSPTRRASVVPAQLFVDDLLERLERLCAADHAAVDEKGRRPVHARFFAVADVGVDLRFELMRVDARVELRGVEAQFDRVLLQIGCAQLRRVGKQTVMVWPEFSLLVGARRGFGRR